MPWYKGSRTPHEAPRQPAHPGASTHDTPGSLGGGTGQSQDPRNQGARDRYDLDIERASSVTSTHITSDFVTTSEQEQQKLPSEASNQRLGPNTSILSSPPERESGTQSLEEGINPRGFVTRPPDSNYDHVSEGPHVPIQSGRSNGRFGPLIAALSAVSTNYAGKATTGEKAMDLITRVATLEELFDSHPPGSKVEQNRRNAVIRKLETAESRLRPLSDGSGSQHSATTTQRDGEVCGVLEDLQEIISEYQTERQKETYNRRCREMDPADVAVLNNFLSARGAEYRHGNHKGCLKGTRRIILDEIENWARDFSRSPLYWLNGLAGTGKSTIAQTIAGRLFAEGQLGASFFCSRDFEDRSNLQLIFPTLAVQLARNYLEFRLLFVPLVQSDPEIAHEPLHDQLSKLVTEPLGESNTSTVIVIDALDECRDDETTSQILSVLGRLVSETAGVKFFLTGRPEPRIQTGFRLPLLKKATDIFVLHGIEPSLVANDIRTFLKHSFSEIVVRHGGSGGWPTDEDVEHLCERAEGLFIYVVAIIKFITKQGCSPERQLKFLLESPTSSAREARTEFRPKTTLDSLYTSILREAYGDDEDPDNDSIIRSVFGVMALATNSLSPSSIAALLGFGAKEVFQRLSWAQSLLILQDENHPVRPLHKSFTDFLVDQHRCTDKRFYISPPEGHSQLLINCLDLLDRMLERNMCKLPDAVANSDVGDLKQRTERYIDPALRYACKSWHTHLVAGLAASVEKLGVASALQRFLEKKFLFWLEVLSVLNAVRNAVDALQAVMEWMEESPTWHLANDCFRFVTGHFEIISTSSSHIYHSALALTPRTSIVRKLYGPHAKPLVRVVRGVPESWDSTIATTKSPFDIWLAAWSPCSRFIAVSKRDTVAMDVLDSTTLQRLQSLKPPQEISADPWALVFSPGSHMLTCMGGSGQGVFVISWDLRTGGLVSAIKHKVDGLIWEPRWIAYSTDGEMVGVLYRRTSEIIISVYAVVNGVHSHDVHHNCPDNFLIEEIWTDGDNLRLAIPESTTITIWEVGFAKGSAWRKIETLSGPSFTMNSGAVFRLDMKDIRWRAQFLPSTHLLALAYPDPEYFILVWDTQNSKFLLCPTRFDSDPDLFPSRMAFSSDGRFLACTTTSSEVYLWKESSTGYVIHQKLVSNTANSTPLLSPNGESLIAFKDSTIQLWHTRKSTTVASAVIENATLSTQSPQQTDSFVLEFLPDRPLAAVARKKDNIVMVLDLVSSCTHLTICAGMEVYGLGANKNALVVIGNRKAIVWELPEGHPPGARMGVEDGVQTINLELSLERVVAGSISSDFLYIAILSRRTLIICSGATGQVLRVIGGWGKVLRFTTGGHDIWYARTDKATGWTIAGDDGIFSAKESPETRIEDTPLGCHWRSSRGYRATNDGWVLGPGEKRLMMLPPSWRSDAIHQAWDRSRLALLSGHLLEPVILELEPQS